MRKRLKQRSERGTGLVGTSFGALVFLAFMALATHTLVGLYATSVLTSVAWDDAKRVADHPGDSQQADAAQADAYRRLSGYKDVQINVAESADDIAFNVSAERPNLLPAGLAHATGTDRINRTVHVRPEQMQ